MLPLLFTLLLSAQWVAGDEVPRIHRQQDLAASPHVLSQLLVPISPKFVLRDNGDGCPDGYHVCPNFPTACAPDGSFCCSAAGNCPDNTNCYGTDQCCPQNAQTCGGPLCCHPTATCCNGNTDCCDVGTFCCNDEFGGCCSDGTTCTTQNTCALGGSGGGGGGSGGGSGGGGSGGGSGGGTSSGSGGSSSAAPGGGSGGSPGGVPTGGVPTGGAGGGGIPSPTQVVVSTVSANPVHVSTATIAGIPTSSKQSSAGGASSTPVFGGSGGSPHCISALSIGKTIGLAVVVGVISFGGSLF